MYQRLYGGIFKVSLIYRKISADTPAGTIANLPEGIPRENLKRILGGILDGFVVVVLLLFLPKILLLGFVKNS